MHDWASHNDLRYPRDFSQKKICMQQDKADGHPASITRANNELNNLQDLFGKVDNSKTKIMDDPNYLSKGHKISVFYDAKGNELYKKYTNTHSPSITYSMQGSDGKTSVSFVDNDGDGKMDKFRQIDGVIRVYDAQDTDHDGVFDSGWEYK